MKQLKRISIFLLTLVLTLTFLVIPAQAASLSAPKITTVYASRNSIFVCWPKSTDCTGYEVQYSVNSNYSKSKTAKFSSNTTWGELKNLQYSKKYYIRVRKYKGALRSAWTKTYCYTRNKNETRRTYIKSISPVVGGFKVAWNPITKSNGYLPATGYQVRYSTDSTFKTGVKTVNVSGKYSSKTINGVGCKKKYYVQVRTYRTVNKKNYYSLWCGTKYVTTKGVSNTTLVSVSPDYYAFTAKWNKVGSATGYQIKYSTKSDMSNPVTVKISKNTTTSYKVQKLKANTTYYVQVQAYNTVNNGSKNINYYGAFSSKMSVKTKGNATCSVPKVKSLKAPAYKTAGLYWEALTGASGYEIQMDCGTWASGITNAEKRSKMQFHFDTLVSNGGYKKSENGYYYIDITNGATTSYKKTGLKPNYECLARMRAYRYVNGVKVYSKWTDVVGPIKITEDTSNYLTASQRQWVVDNTVAKFSQISGKKITYSAAIPGSYEYNQMMTGKDCWLGAMFCTQSNYKTTVKEAMDPKLGWPDGLKYETRNHFYYCFRDYNGETWFMLYAVNK